MPNLPNKKTIPLYSRVSTIMQNKIISGQYEPGEKLPTEDALAQYFKVSKITIRNALSILENQGLIKRCRGKGTFVNESLAPPRQTVFTNMKTLDLALQGSRAIPLAIDEINVSESRFPKDIHAFFHMSNSDVIGRIKRIISGRTISYYYENYMPMEISRHITREDIYRIKSVQAILREKIDLRVARGDMYLQAVPAEPDIAEALDCQMFEPLIHIQTHFWMEPMQPFEIVDVFFRACFFKYKVAITMDRLL